MPGRNYVGNAYRYGYQGQYSEKDDETNQNSFELRNYDGLLGRWMTTDPSGQHHSPYLAIGNSPVNSVDPNGGEDICPTCPTDGTYDGAINSNMGFTYNETDGLMLNTVEVSDIGAGTRNYGGDYSGSFMDNTYYVMDQINQFNPIANGWDAFTGYVYGRDRFGNSQSSFKTNLKFATTILPIFRVGGVVYSFGAYKLGGKWLSQMSARGWTGQTIQEAITSGETYPATNLINPANTAIRYVHPITGQSLVIDDITKEIIHLGGPGFKY